ncbi:MAG: DUF1499 domain-containing protein [Natronospirillum sp.]|uniref:DUF1499 domain-containing protein n=1 Tax=Natronospirillum sp. TaxID=2812955 RepID=UPI0026008CA1|nr:DUF1499 domain-containing protein [Natronospirillum sp.]MCH8552821.1 DUF1499 domain-containing protein [Natronospirillum sp.]
MFHLLIGLLILALVVTLLLRLVVNPLSGSAAGGLTDQYALTGCVRTTNCVSSQEATDSYGYIAPLETGQADGSLDKAASVLKNAGPHHIVKQDERYLHAVFTTPLMGYRDDLELLVDADNPGQLQVRSSSRIGRNDFGKNRQRVEKLRQALAQ